MSNANWWAQKLAGNQPSQQPYTRPDPTPAMPPSQQPMAPMPQFQPQQPPAAAKSARSTATCPECGSGNFMPSNGQSGARCFECGYPIEQSGSLYGALAGARVEGAARQATGNDTKNNWNPQGIIGRID